MGAYQPLTDYLLRLHADEWRASFADVERVLGRPLPDSASKYPAWWANQSGPGHSQTRGWQDAGFETREVDLRGGRVRFIRRRGGGNGPRPAAARASHEPHPDLWLRARQITGIEDRDALIEAALQALIQREAGRALIEMGGTMPDAKAPPRRRFW
ncbi:MAG: type II toxin-antitoxin system VapB family antitoxin [Porphyrobacter sp.]|nr:type II toxin-antitoxin system VapB family antitoxin [Porphyrobacter sp.]